MEYGLLAAIRQLRGALPPTSRQPGIEAVARPVSSRRGGADLRKRVLAIDMERCPRCESGTLRIIAALTCRSVLFPILALPPGASQAGR